MRLEIITLIFLIVVLIPIEIGGRRHRRHRKVRCSKKLAAICASNGLTYKHQCALVWAKKQLGELAIRHKGPCKLTPPLVPTTKPTDEPAPQFSCRCHRNHKPVCGSDGQSYTNLCRLNCARNDDPKLSLVSEGACAPKELTPEPTTMATHNNNNKRTMIKKRRCKCTREYNPVCASDGGTPVTHGTNCTLQCDQFSNPDLVYVRDGECEETSTVRTSAL